MVSGYHTMLFDLDGTVLDSIGMIKASLRHALATQLDWHPDEPTLVRGVGTPLFEQLNDHAADAARARGDAHPETALVERLVQAYIEHNLATHDLTVRPFPMALSVLTRLQSAGVRLGIVTSKPHHTARRGLRVTGLEPLFEIVVGADDISRPKPHPEPVHHAIGLLDVPSAGTLFVGDSPHDMHAGRAAGVHTAAALWGPFPREVLAPSTPTHWVDTLDGLFGLA